MLEVSLKKMNSTKKRTQYDQQIVFLSLYRKNLKNPKEIDIKPFKILQ